MPAVIRSAEPLDGKPVVTVKQRGIKAYTIKVKRVNNHKFKVTLKAKRTGRKGRLVVIVSGTDVRSGDQQQRFELKVR